MTVKQLKEKLASVPDDMEVVILREDVTLGGFFWEPACVSDCGVVDPGEPDEDAGEVGEGGKVFQMAVCQCHCEATSAPELN